MLEVRRDDTAAPRAGHGRLPAARLCRALPRLQARDLLAERLLAVAAGAERREVGLVVRAAEVQRHAMVDLEALVEQIVALHTPPLVLRGDEPLHVRVEVPAVRAGHPRGFVAIA